MGMLAVRTSDQDQSELAIARAVDANAFERIMRRHNRMLYRIARSILREDAEAEECLQSAYLLAFRSLGSFNGQAKLSTWLARIVINEALGRKRRAARGDDAIISVESAADSRAVEQGTAALAAGPPRPESEAMHHQLGALRESLAQDPDGASDEEAFAFVGARCDRLVVAAVDRVGRSAPPDRAVHEPLAS